MKQDDFDSELSEHTQLPEYDNSSRFIEQQENTTTMTINNDQYLPINEEASFQILQSPFNLGNDQL